MLLVASCDALTQKDEPQPPPPFAHVVAANVGTQAPLPQDGVIELGFDRFLNPLTVNRQSLGLRDAFGGAPDSPIVQYDPVARVATLSNPNPGQPWLEVGKSYQVVFPIANAEAGSFGLRTIDGASLDPSTGPLGFQIAPPTGNPPSSPKIDFCADVFPIFAATRADPTLRGACSASACHGGSASSPTSAMGLVLESEDGVRRAIGAPARETANGGLTTPLAPQPAFPVGMPLIDPGNPGDSYLIYKLLLADDDTVPDASGASVPYTLGCGRAITAPFDYGPGASFASPDEAARLASRITGRRMPWGSTPLTFDEIERISLWIAQGAGVDDCSSCPATVP